MMAIRRSLTALAGLLLILGLTGAQAAPLQVSLSANPTTCQNMTVSFDSTAGTAPWTITIAPLGHIPITVALPPNYSSDPEWDWNWRVPGYPTSSQVIVAVSDSTGKVSGTSAFAQLATGGRCSAPPEPLDFIWFPPTAAPRQCDDWPFTVQEDAGNSGMKMPVDMLVIPENDVPTRLRITNNRQGSVDWTVNYPVGTNFAVAGYDAGPAGNGGVGGDVYTVVRGNSATCLGQTQNAAVAGLPAASSTAAALPASPTASRAPTSKTHAKPTSASVKASATAGAKNPIDASSSSGSNSGSSAGKIGGAVGGVLAAVTVVGLAIYFYRRHQANRGPDEYGVYPSTEKRSFFGGFGSGRSADRGGFLGGRIGASTDQQGGISPFVTGRSSWRWSSKPAEAPFARMNDAAASSHGHSSSISLHRGRDSYGGGIPMSAAPSVHSVVPDEALFPPPMPTNRNMMQNHAGYGAGSGAAGVGAGVGAGLDPFRNPSQTHLPSPPVEKPLPLVQQEQQSNFLQRQHPASRDSMAAIAGLPLSPSSGYSRSRDLTSLPPINQDKLDLSTMRIAPPAPVSTSLFDPYAHASSPYAEEEIGQHNTALQRNEHRYADPKESEGRFRTLDAQLVDERKKVTSKAEEDDSDDEGGLPYM